MSLYRAVASLLVSMYAFAALAAPRVDAKLIPDASAVSPGSSFRLGILFTIPQRSHIYWLNPGDSGLPTSIEWSVPEGFEVGELQWPSPSAFYDEVLDETSFGYEGEVLLFATIRAPYTIQPGDQVPIRAQATWLICLEDGQCIPEDAALELMLESASESAPSPNSEVFDAYAARVPATIRESGLTAQITVSGQPEPSVKLVMSEPWLIDLRQAAPQFFPYSGGSWLMTDDNEGFEDATEVTFVPTGAVTESVRGVLTLHLTNPGSGESQIAYLRFGAQPNAN